MVRISNNLLGLLNIITLLISLPIIVYSLYLYFDHHVNSGCHKFLEFPLLIFGVFLFLVSLCGLIGSCCRAAFLLWIYLFVMFILIIGLFCFTIFAFIVTHKGVGEVVSGRGYKEYRLGDYSHWLQKRFTNADNWEKINSCLHDAKVCESLGHGVYQKAEEFYKRNLSPIQSGCCKPPTYCSFTYMNATYWTAPNSGLANSTGDCIKWSNNQDELCFDCMSCKAGFIANLKIQWRKIAIVNVASLILLIFVYSLGCCAFRNNRVDNGYKRHRAPHH
ncbi:tetraspanin-8-like [Tasmannia lanceolata]|uniref:tetraspanin-8-like n=1 Tax=Tasmannia lanceolata TaxID=3420 RepID=UPI0040630ACC